MDKSIIDALISLGLSNKELKFFEACFKHGPITIGDAVKVARLERSTGYLVAEYLLSRGLLEHDSKQYGRKLIAAEPKKILRMISSKQRDIYRKELALQEKLAEVQALYQANTIRPKVRSFEGKNGLISIIHDILSSKGEILLWTNQGSESSFFSQEFHNKFIMERVRKGIPIRVLSINNRKGKELIETDNVSLRKTKLLPSEVSFSAETYIYENKVAIIDYKKDIIGVIIESEPIAAAQRAIFEMNWKLL